ncbi:TetR family transcriptional regulator C-terminal domain-containing protein [Stratiformator vulcanicus]|uniref:Transcriptional regulator AcuR n=1 Tax=Stratiformator vulcanicus TaxID=2527980 RepID=A0A517R7P1_9PLAN|nr:TetR family transcriptional regulator C-terminal domain-containing protein [Stratiformator vulcanicus]QDT39904.1 Transcriptional regulator AcuR [Stratiformator vulcanicus]
MARPRLSDDKRRELIDRGAQLLLSGGFHGTGLKTLLDDVGVPKGSFYNYFESKEHFGAEVIREVGRRSVEKLRAQVERFRDGISGLRAFFREQIRGYEANPCHGGCLLGAMGNEIAGESKLCREALAARFCDFEETLAKGIAKAQAAGKVREDLSAEVLGRAIFAAWEGALIRMKVAGSTAPLTEFETVFLKGFLAK